MERISITIARREGAQRCTIDAAWQPFGDNLNRHARLTVKRPDNGRELTDRDMHRVVDAIVEALRWNEPELPF